MRQFSVIGAVSDLRKAEGLVIVATGGMSGSLTMDTSRTTEEAMLVQMRDILYEGDWDDFVADLTARLEGRAHVFQTVAPQADMLATIARHLAIIAEMRERERKGPREGAA